MPNRSRNSMSGIGNVASRTQRMNSSGVPRASSSVDFPDRAVIVDRRYDYDDRPVYYDRSCYYPRPRYFCEPAYIETGCWPAYASCDNYYGYGYGYYARSYHAYSDFRWGVSFSSGGSSFAFSSGYVDYEPVYPVVYSPVWPSTCIVPARYVTPWWGVYRPSAGWYYPTYTYVNVNSPWVIPTSTVVADPYLTTPATYLPNPPAPAPVSDTEASLLDRAIGAMQAESYDEAVEGFRRHLKDNFDDAYAMRQLAVAFVATRQMDDAAAMMRMAYRVDPGLAPYVINRRELGLTPGELRTFVNRSVEYANDIQSGSSWLLVASLMQAEGRNDVAKEMLERSRKAGGDRDLIDAFQAAMP
ncbi:MAG: hypothetical protein PSX37_05105 [bacterium]|nr:hypothetical protein [bacterium]